MVLGQYYPAGFRYCPIPTIEILIEWDYRASANLEDNFCHIKTGKRLKPLCPYSAPLGIYSPACFYYYPPNLTQLILVEQHQASTEL